MLLGHKLPRGNLAGVLKEALRCAIEKHGKRKGAVKPARSRTRSAAPPAEKNSASLPTSIPAEVRRQVWERDGGRCAWTAPDGTRCGSRWQLELNHVQPRALGGPSTLENLRLRCRAHNLLHAEHLFGRGHMDRYRRDAAETRRDVP